MSPIGNEPCVDVRTSIAARVPVAPAQPIVRASKDLKDMLSDYTWQITKHDCVVCHD